MIAPLSCELKYEAEISRFARSVFDCSRIVRKEYEGWYSSCYALRAVSSLEGCI
jgi:hypothetical protein